MHTWCDCFWFYFSLVEKLARVFLANQSSNRNRIITFDSHLKIALSISDYCNRKIIIDWKVEQNHTILLLQVLTHWIRCFATASSEYQSGNNILNLNLSPICVRK